MSGDVKKHFVSPKFNTPVTGKLRKVLENDTKNRCKMILNALGNTNGESGGVSMMLKTGIEVDQDYSFFNYETPIS